MNALLAAHHNDLVLIALGLATGATTWIGGSLALRHARRLSLILGFSAGAVIGVALLDLLPEAMALGAPRFGAAAIAAFIAGGFVVYLVVDRLILLLAQGEGHRGHFGAGSLTAHSLLDGLGIGFGFQVSPSVGIILALAVLAHDLADGMNTVTLSLRAAHDPRIARRWLAADAAAPLAGIALSRLIVIGPGRLAPAIAAFAGLFLYIGASELLPDSHRRHPRLWTTAASVLGVVFIGVIVHLAARGTPR